MKKVSISNKKATSGSRNNIIPTSYQGGVTASFEIPAGFLLPNRWFVEIQKNQTVSHLQTATDIKMNDDISNISFATKTAASQTGESCFQETRIFQARVLREKTLVAIQRTEERRKKYLEQDLLLDE